MRKARKTSIKKLWQQYRFSAIVFATICVLVFFVYHFLSDGDFSFLMTLGSLLTVVSFGLLVIKYGFTRSVSGISLKSLQLYAAVFAFRLCSILFYEGYLPYDRSGDWFYQVCEVLCLAMVCFLIVAGTVLSRRPSGDKEHDSFRLLPFVPKHLGALVLVVPCFVLALIFHPSLNSNFLTDTAWTFALYLEAVAILPQLVMFYRQSKKEEEVETYTANFVFGVAAARILSFVFWLSSYHELNDKYAETFHRKYPGALVVLAQVVNLALLVDYVWIYLRAARRAGPILIRSV